jgi:hypothetical protein
MNLRFPFEEKPNRVIVLAIQSVCQTCALPCVLLPRLYSAEVYLRVKSGVNTRSMGEKQEIGRVPMNYKGRELPMKAHFGESGTIL